MSLDEECTQADETLQSLISISFHQEWIFWFLSLVRNPPSLKIQNIITYVEAGGRAGRRGRVRWHSTPESIQLAHCSCLSQRTCEEHS